MTIIIRDYEGNEEILQKQGIQDIIWASIFLFLILVLPRLLGFNFDLISLILSLSMSALVVYSIFFGNRNIIFDKGIKSVVIGKRRIINKRIKWKDIEKIKFSDIKEVNIVRRGGEDGGIDYQIKLILVEGNLSIYTVHEPLWVRDRSKTAKELAIRLCKAIGVKGYHIDEKNNKTLLWSEGNDALMKLLGM